MTTSIPSSSDYLSPAPTIVPGAIYVWPPVHWLIGHLVLVRPRPDKETGVQSVLWTSPPDAFYRYDDQCEDIVARAKRRPCLVLASSDEIPADPAALQRATLRVVPLYAASSPFITSRLAEIAAGRFLRMISLPSPPWTHKDNVLDFKAACHLPASHLLAGTQLGRLSVPLFRAVRAAFAQYITSDVAVLPPPEPGAAVV